MYRESLETASPSQQKEMGKNGRTDYRPEAILGDASREAHKGE
jgi:hypothetical protein